MICVSKSSIKRLFSRHFFTIVALVYWAFALCHAVGLLRDLQSTQTSWAPLRKALGLQQLEMEGAPMGEGGRQIGTRKEYLLLSVRRSAHRDAERNRDMETFWKLFVFTFVVKTHGKQPAISTSSGMKVHEDYDGQCSKLHSWHHSLSLVEWESKGESEICSGSLIREDSFYIWKQPSLCFMDSEIIYNPYVINWWLFSKDFFFWNYFMFGFRDMLPSPLSYNNGNI